jgi:hypothetical protein
MMVEIGTVYEFTYRLGTVIVGKLVDLSETHYILENEAGDWVSWEKEVTVVKEAVELTGNVEIYEMLENMGFGEVTELSDNEEIEVYNHRYISKLGENWVKTTKNHYYDIREAGKNTGLYEITKFDNLRKYSRTWFTVDKITKKGGAGLPNVVWEKLATI